MILTIVSYVCLDPILTLMQIPADIYGLMRSYMGLILAGLIFVFLYNYFAFLLRSSGNSVIPLIFLGVGTALNIGLDFFFVAKLGRGVKGAAEATVLAQAAAGLGIALYALVKEPELNMKKMKEEGYRYKGRSFERDLFLFCIDGNPAVCDEFRDTYGSGTCEQFRNIGYGGVRCRGKD